MNRIIAIAALAVCAAMPQRLLAGESRETQLIREEIRKMREDYESRIRALEQRLQQAESKTAPAPAAPPPPSLGSGERSFNPKISLILQGSYADFESPAEPAIPGFLLGPETELRPDGFSLGETELVLEANVDDKFHGWATIALENEDGETVVALEEAYLNTLALPNGFALKFGRFFSDIGYLNRVHSHAWDFADQPLVYRAMLANQFKDDGIQLRWIAPTDLYFEAGGELLRGAAFPAGGEDRSGVNATTVYARLGGDVGTGGSYRAGVSHIRARADERETEDEETGAVTVFDGDSDITGLDFVYKWAPDGNPALNNFIFQAEYFVRNEDGSVSFDDGVLAVTSPYDGRQQGWYLQGVYQFRPQWRAGLRYDRLTSDNEVPGAPGADTTLDTLADSSPEPERWSAMLDWSGSEFSRIRLQYNRDESRPGGVVDDQWLLQYIYSLGSHPAHQF